MNKTARISDHELKLALGDRLEGLAGVNADEVGVAITGGIVTLAGQVATYQEKGAAIRATAATPGVISIVDELTVATPWGASDDAELARSAASVLQATHIRPDGDITAEVKDASITLRGSVPWQHERSALLNAVRTLPGVASVCNAITVVPPELSSPDEIAALITDALVEIALSDARNIQVELAGSEVTLAGLVSSHDESRRAENAARSAPGVTDVDNRLSVKYRPLAP